jgi:hypothetical protein
VDVEALERSHRHHEPRRRVDRLAAAHHPRVPPEDLEGDVVRRDDRALERHRREGVQDALERTGSSAGAR